MKQSTSHFFALDVACNKGITISVGGKPWTFSGLTLSDLGELMVTARSEALRAWREAGPPSDSRQKNQEMNSILFGTAGQNLDDALRLPKVRRRMVELSLAKSHPKLTQAELDGFFESEEFAVALVGEVRKDIAIAEVLDLILMQTTGPSSEGATSNPL